MNYFSYRERAVWLWNFVDSGDMYELVMNEASSDIGWLRSVLLRRGRMVLSKVSALLSRDVGGCVFCSDILEFKLHISPKRRLRFRCREMHHWSSKQFVLLWRTICSSSSSSSYRRRLVSTMQFSRKKMDAPGRSVRGERANFTRLVLGCIEAKFCK